MPSIITASTASNTALNFSADTSGVLEIRTGSSPTTAMTIDGSQNVGIGTSSPSAKLDISINNSNVGNGSSLQLEQAGTGDAAISFLIGIATEWLAGVDNSDSDKFKINNITGGSDFNNTGLTIDTSGNVGIGTNSPATRLGVSGAISFVANLSMPAVDSAIYRPADGSIALGTNSTERMRIDSSGNVGIGKIPSTNRTLEIATATSITNIVLQNTTTGSSSIDGTLLEANGSDTLLVNYEAGNMRFFTSGIERMRIDSNGRMTMVSQPAFAARGFSNTNPGVKTFNSVPLNVGSHYNNSNGRFTAPIAGEYYISASFLVNAGFSDIQFGLRVNGTDWAELKTGGSTVFSTSWSGVIPLAANDYVDFNYVSASTGATVTGNAFGQFSGFLLG